MHFFLARIEALALIIAQAPHHLNQKGGADPEQDQAVAEGSPISLFEAMSFGLPIIASRVGSVPSVVRHDAEALLVRPGDRYELVSALERVLPDAGLREQLGKSARARFREEYTADKMAERYDAFYDSILES